MTTTVSPWPLPDEGVRLNLGCQADYKPGWINVDLTPPGDLFFDLDETWPIESDSVDFILASQVIEHLYRPAHFLAEAWRVLKPGRTMVVLTEAPHVEFYRDPTHVRPFTVSTFAQYAVLEDDVRPEGMPRYSHVEAVLSMETIENQPPIPTISARMTK